MYGLLAAEWRAARDGRRPRATILHGFTADPSKHWFPWLAERLEAHGFDVRVPALPDADAPDPSAWVAAASDAIGDARDGDVVIGHSLGCATALRALADLDRHRTAARGAAGPRDAGSEAADSGSSEVAPAERLGALVLVAGFGTALDSLPELDGFTDSAMSGVDAARIPRLVRRIATLRSDADEIVPASASDALADALGAPVEIVRGAGHFLDREGVRALPEALRAAVLAV
ncbi:serine hydrolase family protein [Leucobacter zeae]|nr:serine hydrolase family protein [Leucobacter zeae]